MTERKERLQMTGFKANVKIDGTYKTFPLVDITEDGIAIHAPETVTINKGDQFEIRYDIIDEHYGSFDVKLNRLVKKEGVAGTGIVMRIQKINEHENLIGLKMDYVEGEQKEAAEKVKKAKAIIQKLTQTPKAYIEFAFQVEEQARDARLRGYPKFEGVLTTEDFALRFLVDAEYEFIFLEGDSVSIRIPAHYEGRPYFECMGTIESNHIFNMYKNAITVKLDVWDKADQEFVINVLDRHNRESEEILKFMN